MEDLLAIEIKSTTLAQSKHLHGLRALAEECLIKESIVVSQDPNVRKIDSIVIYPWKEFLNLLWKGTWF